MKDFQTSDWILTGILISILFLVFTEVVYSIRRDHVREHLDHEILDYLKQIKRILGQVLRAVIPIPSAFEIIQIGEDGMPTNLSIAAGASGTFQAVPQPAGSVIPAGATAPQWVASDPSVTITSGTGGTPDPTGLTVTVAVAATDTAASFTLGISGPDGASGATISGSVTVTIVPSTTGGNAPTSFAINQLS